MVDLDTALAEAMALYDPDFRHPDVSVFMARQRAELVDWDEREHTRRSEPDDDEADDYIGDD